MIEFLHTTVPTPIAFAFGNFAVHWYGLLILLGGVIGFAFIFYLTKQYGFKKDDIYDLTFYWILAALIGARLYYVIYAWPFYKDNLFSIIAIWEGGLAIHGVIIGGVVATVVYAWKKRLDFWRLVDVTVPGMILAQAFGRWGNYFNQEIFGRPTDAAWGIPISPGLRPLEYIDSVYFHPTFLYESLANLVIFVILMSFHWLFLKKGKKVFAPGVIFLSYLILYSIVRVGMEFIRVDYSPVIFGVRWAHIMSAGTIVIAVILMITAMKVGARKKK